MLNPSFAGVFLLLLKMIFLIFIPLFIIGWNAWKIVIYYDPTEPRKFMIYDPKAEYLVASVGILVGLGIIYLMFFFNWDSKPPF